MSQPPDERSIDSPTPLIGTVLGRYQIERPLGQGGMGEVFLARDTLLSRHVALKRVLAVGADRAQAHKMILREARRASQINDPHVAAIYDILDVGEQVVLVMEYVDGTTLRERMSEPLPLDQFWDLATQCAEGMAAAHARGVIHRDLKPENLMVTRGGLVKILDFGVARRTPSGTGSATTSTDNQSVIMAGTPHYMAPEVHFGEPADERSDIFALGVVFYEMLTTSQPFKGTSYGAVLDRVLRSEPAPVSELNPSVGESVSNLVARMLAKNPRDRIATTPDLLREMSDAQRGIALPAPGPSTFATPAPRVPQAPAVKRRARWLLPATLAVAAVLAVGIGLRWRDLLGPALPPRMNLALLAPTISGQGDFVPFALGAFDNLSTRLRRQTRSPNFQLASFSDGVDQKIASALEARKLLGVNLALLSRVEQAADAYRARLELRDAASGKLISTRSVQVPAAQPFLFLDRLESAATSMLHLDAAGDRGRFNPGIRGAGTLRFHLQGIGRLRSAQSGDAEKAIADFETASRMEPESALPHAGLVGAELRLHDSTQDSSWLKRAEASARQAVALDPSRAESHRALASVLAREKRHGEAALEFERVAALDPTDDEASHLRARMFNRLGQPEREKEIYLATIARRSHCWQPYWWLATWHFHRGDVEEAAQNFREMIRRSPDYSEGYTDLGAVLVLRGDYDAAIDTLKRSLTLRPNRNAFDNLGTAYFNSGRVQEAVDAYNQSFQFGDAGYVSWMNLGDAYSWLQGRDQDAAGAYAQAIRMARDEIHNRSTHARSVDLMIPANLAMMFARIGKADSARVYLGRALAGDSTNAFVQYGAALTLWQLGEKERAMVWLEKSVHGGYPVAWLRDSPVFKEWRGVPSFRALVGTAGSRPQQAASRS
jgi:serine/threonine-protein kinase